jgi:hypothetical protein
MISRTKGWARYATVLFVAFFGAGVVAATYLPRAPQQTLYGLRVRNVLSRDSWQLISPATGPFRADFCPEFDAGKLEPRPGYVVCKLQFTDRGCMAVGARDQVIWVKNKAGWTVPLADDDTFEPWPACMKNGGR